MPCSPFWAENGNCYGGEHWRLLVLDFKDKACRYYETLQVPASDNLQAAVKVLGLVNDRH